MRARNKAALGGAIQSVAGKHTGAGGGAGRHILWTHGFALLEIANGHAGVFDVGAAGQTRNLDRGPRRSVAEFKPLGVMLVHDPRREFR